MIDSKCLNCGASLDISTVEDYVKCNYCQSVLANYRSFKNLQALSLSSSDSSEIETMAKLLEINDYEALLQSAEAQLNKQPLSYVAMTYKAIALFWLGYDNFSHLQIIFDILAKAVQVSENNEIVVRAREALCNDIIVLAAKNEIYGDDLVVSLRAFEIATQLSKLKARSEEVLKDYCNKAYHRYKSNLEELILKQKKDYDPPAQAIINLTQMAKYFSGEKECIEFIYLHGKHHLQKNQSKSYYASVKALVDQLGASLTALKSDVVGKSLTFNFLGKLVVK